MAKKLVVVIFYLLTFVISVILGEELAQKARGERYLETIQYRLQGDRVIGKAINPRPAKLSNFTISFEVLDKKGNIIGTCEEFYDVKLPDEIWEFNIPCSTAPHKVQPSALTYSLFNP